MFEERITSGKHIVCDIKGIQNVCLLNSSKELTKLLCNICEKYNFQILKKICYDFVPEGCSIIFLLSESHISIHTFPEKNHISFDLYTCREYENNIEYEEIYNYLIQVLNASSKSNYKIIDRFF
jgi:S-adenosylmethionine decarboxylase